jgi:hypothetical protein
MAQSVSICKKHGAKCFLYAKSMAQSVSICKKHGAKYFLYVKRQLFLALDE